jgi:hypothetical protein
MSAPWKYDATKELEIHPLASIFPEMSEGEFKVFSDDIKEKGLQTKITIHEGKVIEGRQRYKAMLKVRSWDLKDECFQLLPVGVNPVDYVISMNVNRRHLSTSQRALIASRLVTTKLGFNQHANGVVTFEKAAKMLNVGETILKDGKVVFENGAKEVIEKIQKGDLTIGKAKEIIKKPGRKAGYFSKEDQVEKLNNKPAASATAVVTPPSTARSDNLDREKEAYIEALKELRERSADNADAAVAELVKDLQLLDFLKDYKPKSKK